jgi:trehalose 6-phosphate phosphatase
MQFARAYPACVEELLRRFAEEPQRAAILLDVDGVLAPIVLRPEDSRVPPETRAELERLARKYALVACVSGRTSADAERIVGVPDIVYVGSHGLELAPEAEHWRDRLHRFGQAAEWPVEDKGLTVSFHYRGVDDEGAAREQLERVAEAARREGLLARFGRKVLELRPPIEADKGTAVTALLTDRGLQRALYAGDDTTDLDGFRGLDGLEVAVRVAVASPEGPPELREAADLVVDGPAGALELLKTL